MAKPRITFFPRGRFGDYLSINSESCRLLGFRMQQGTIAIQRGLNKKQSRYLIAREMSIYQYLLGKRLKL